MKESLVFVRGELSLFLGAIVIWSMGYIRIRRALCGPTRWTGTMGMDWAVSLHLGFPPCRWSVPQWGCVGLVLWALHLLYELNWCWVELEWKKKSVFLAISPGLSLILFYSFSVAFGWGSLFYPQFRIPSLPIKNLEENVISFPLPIPVRYSPSSLLRSVSSLSIHMSGSVLSAQIASACDYLGYWFGCNSSDQTAMI